VVGTKGSAGLSRAARSWLVGSFESMCCVAEGMEVGVRQNTGLERSCRLAFGVGVLFTAILFFFMGLSSFLPAFVEL
jgi:hypothetical protein